MQLPIASGIEMVVLLIENVKSTLSSHPEAVRLVFADAGNIWLLNEDDYFDNGNFEFNRFYKEIAVDVGVGLRLDFNFFVLRLDAGCPVFDPCPRYYSTDDGEMILPFSFSLLNTKFNLAIGYPF